MGRATDYALLFVGHSFEYEVQAVAKIFVPGVRFALCHDAEGSEYPHRILTEITPDGRLRAEVTLRGRHAECTSPAPVSNEKDAVEFALCTLLYEVLQEITGYLPPWGMLTGIRPVRKVIQLLEAGETPEEACRKLQTRYRISEEKMRLALETALVQQPILPHSEREIGFYVSIPFCPTRCSYCSFVSHSMATAYKLIPGYLEKLCEEIAVYGRMIREHGLTVQSVYIGGGTPTSITAEQLRMVMEAVAEYIDIGNAREYTVEAGRADTITEEKLRVIKEMGATRISVNPQTLQDSVLQAIGRRHTAQQAVEAFELARKIGFDDINMDLIAGLPTDTYEGFEDTLHRVMALDPDSITVHTLTLKRAATLYHDRQDQSAEIAGIAKMAALSAEQLPKSGWRPYYLYRQKNTLGNLENVGYAKPGKENLYNILIMDETQTILAAGCAASTKLVEKNGDITRVMNYKFPFEYIDRFDLMMEKKCEIEKVLTRMERNQQW